MVSNDLEKSLRDAVSRHFDERVSDLQQEVARLQTGVNDAFARLAERLADDGETSQALASTVAEHLHTAHTEGIEEAVAHAARARASSDVALIKAAIDDIDNQRTQTDILNALVNRAASFAPRIAFFIIKNNRATGWRARGLEGTVGDEAVREISLPLEQRTLISEIVESKQSWSGAATAHEDDKGIYNVLGSEQAPERLVAVPLVARGRTVAALYADSADLDADAVNLEALETMVRVAGMAVELLATNRPAPLDARTPPAPQPFIPPPPSVAPPARHASTQPFTHTPPMPSSPDAAPPANVSDSSSARGASDSTGDTNQPASVSHANSMISSPDSISSPGSMATEATTGALDESPPTATAHASAETTAPPTAVETPGQPSPLGTARSYGRSGAQTDLPVEVADEEERRFHNEARRFARLLVSEIKLYNEQKVREGRASADIYARLTEEIDRSREMYDKRVRPEVVASYDYFHTEIVNTLAEGDDAKLGNGYPGAIVS